MLPLASLSRRTLLTSLSTGAIATACAPLTQGPALQGQSGISLDGRNIVNLTDYGRIGDAANPSYFDGDVLTVAAEQGRPVTGNGFADSFATPAVVYHPAADTGMAQNLIFGSAIPYFGDMLVLGNITGESPLAKIYKLSAGDQGVRFIDIANLQSGVYGAAIFQYGAKILVTGSRDLGVRASGAFLEVRDAQSFEIQSASEIKGDNATAFGIEPSDHAPFIFVSGGLDGKNAGFHFLNKQSLAAEDFIALPALPEGVTWQRHDEVALDADGFVYLGTVDEFGKSTGEVYKVDLYSGEVVQKISLRQSDDPEQSFHNALALAGGALFVAEFNSGRIHVLNPENLSPLNLVDTNLMEHKIQLTSSAARMISRANGIEFVTQDGHWMELVLTGVDS
ncbi:MAG: hypothetical protein H7A33_06975 [Deltaproteobacteria bacterium]|nr:hypothetical protein [Deltaproteobacteria bacterium]